MLESTPTTSEPPAIDARDEILMSLNLYGLRNNINNGRARMDTRLTDDPDRSWHLILATGQPGSPFELIGDQIVRHDGSTVAHVEVIEHDDARLGYARDGGRALTANTNRRSTCTGCVFCPNTLTDASDPRMVSNDDAVAAWVDGVLFETGWPNFQHVRQVNLSTGCFGNEGRALSHLRSLRRALAGVGFTGRLGILSSVIRTEDAMKELAELRPFALFLTLECVTRRELLLKESKSDLGRVL